MEEKEIIDKIEKNKKLPEEIKGKILTEIFECFFCAILAYVYFIFLKLGVKNIHLNIYITDLKVFATSLAILGIVFLENSYNHKNAKELIRSIEILVLAIITLLIQYVVLYLSPEYRVMIPSIALIYNVYFILKALVIIIQIRKQHIKSMSDIKEIVQKQPKTQRSE